MKAEHKAVLDRALATWGRDSQVMLALEEMAELSKELLKNINRRRDNIKEIAEELADVYVTLEGIENLYGVSDIEISGLMDAKISRLKARLDALDPASQVSQAL
jgi:NTP pyrophosphatase (non-canonical NTP hydrolase)